MIKSSFPALGFVLSLFVFIGCSEDYTPKPKGFQRIDFPAHSYQQLTEDHPYTFEYSKAAVIKADTFKGAEPHWIFVYYPALKANIQLTYKQIQGDKKRLRGFISDAYKLASKHQEKAYSTKDGVVKSNTGLPFVVFEIAGDVPSHLQFYTTDSTRNFLRGAVYLESATENDSLAPVVEYMKKDALHLIQTMRWKK